MADGKTTYVEVTSESRIRVARYDGNVFLVREELMDGNEWESDERDRIRIRNEELPALITALRGDVE
jgi:hypothetical protein